MSFEELLGELREHEDALLISKGEEYATDNDRLQNFREIASFIGCDPRFVVLVLLLKHIQGIKHAIESGDYTWDWDDPKRGEGLKQRFSDARNYLALLAAAVDDAEEQERQLEHMLGCLHDLETHYGATLPQDLYSDLTDIIGTLKEMST